MSGVTSVFQARLTGSLTSSAPLWPRASQPPNMPPAGWAKNAIRPASETSIGSISAPPPASATRVASASTLSVAKYVDHTGGWPSPMIGVTPATLRPPLRKKR